MTTKSRPLPPIAQLAEVFVVDPTSSSGLRWKVSRPPVKAGDAAGTLHTTGYWQVQFSGRLLKVHRIVYALAHGTDPGELQIDHIDRNKGNNDINNLRLVDNSTNRFNVGPPRNNKLGVKGVYWHKQRSKYQAQIMIRGKQRYLGLFSTLEEAAEARREAEIRFGVKSTAA